MSDQQQTEPKGKTSIAEVILDRDTGAMILVTRKPAGEEIMRHVLTEKDYLVVLATTATVTAKIFEATREKRAEHAKIVAVRESCGIFENEQTETPAKGADA